ncbi:hypothetical protein NKW44_12950 [Acetobacter lovaniensis]|jgi:hypothetical protein|uniref:hypothetical protein n=1 Tax=Acetobacter lovaniensis TaxID=104100 RepID=UPI0020A1ADA0|nr:hypothetical protein [Acetobacter lovaniensis]MCP1240578.1 hypothetical protein [Acetobacter lovaniensis]
MIAAATKAPDDPSHAAKLVWDNYYANHQKKGAFKHLKVADIFMGGGTTLVEGSRLGMQMLGIGQAAGYLRAGRHEAGTVDGLFHQR